MNKIEFKVQEFCGFHVNGCTVQFYTETEWTFGAKGEPIPGKETQMIRVDQDTWRAGRREASHENRTLQEVLEDKTSRSPWKLIVRAYRGRLEALQGVEFDAWTHWQSWPRIRKSKRRTSSSSPPPSRPQAAEVVE